MGSDGSVARLGGTVGWHRGSSELQLSLDEIEE